MTIILGINAYHGDSSACLVRDGQLLAAAEEERFRRIKHWAGLPSQAVAYCLQSAGLSLADVDVIAVNTDPKTAIGKKICFALKRRLSPAVVLRRLRSARQRMDLVDELVAALGGSFSGRLEHVEHHYCHLASAFLVSPFADAVVVSVDGFGDFASAAWGLGQGNCMAIDGRVHFPHSLGLFYTAITQLIGFPQYGDEYKIMGLAPYGEPDFLEQMRRIVRLKPDGSYELDLQYFCHHTSNFKYAWDHGSPEIGRVFTAALEGLLGTARADGEELTQRHKNLARSADIVLVKPTVPPHQIM